MTAHELARKLLEGPDWPVMIERGPEGHEVEIEYIERHLDHPGSESAYIELS